MNFFKNKLIYGVVLLCLSVANAAVVGGHDRQRLSLLLLNNLRLHYQTKPIQFDLSIYPRSFTEEELITEPLAHVSQVLAEEGWLERDDILSQQEVGNRRFTVKTRTYQRVRTGPVILGYIDVESIAVLTLNNSENTQIATVQFTWQAIQLAPWLWAPILSANQEIQMLHASQAHSRTGSAMFEWVNESWRLLSPPVLLISDNN